MSYIYILHFPNGKRYVGQTIRSVGKRMERHWADVRAGNNLPVHNAMRKYGENFGMECVLPIKGEQLYLDSVEDQAITALDTLVPNGYNIRKGGSRGAHSEETKAKISAANRGRVRSEESRAKMAASRKGKPAWNRGKPGTMIGRYHSEETKAKISAACRGRIRLPCTEETKAKMSTAKKGKPGKPRTKETRAKMSAAKRQRDQQRGIKNGT